jgi:NADH-quinone oxidoreductase subunit E
MSEDKTQGKTAKKEFSKTALSEIESVLSSYPVRDSATLPLLHLAQREFGLVDNEVVELIAAVLGVEPLRVRQAASFYTMFEEKPRGKHLIEICNNISCALLGSESILSYVEKRLGISRGATTPDGLVTLRTVECLGSCGTAPVMTVDGRYHEGLTVEKVETVLREIGV